MNLFLGIDVSTTATKALLMDPAGMILASASSEYPYETPKPLWSEQDPELWWQATQRSIRAVLAQTDTSGNHIKAIGMTGQMHGLVLLDERGEVLRPAILWNDQRTGAECEQIRARVGKARLIKIAGNDALTGFTAPKILWVRNHEPEIYARIKHILLPKDYIRYRLTGEAAIDKADGSGTILFDLNRRDWSTELLSTLDINKEWFPPTFEGTEITGSVTRQAAEATGLKSGTPVVAGGGDQSTQAVGVGVVQEGMVALTLGTSGVVFASADKPTIEPEGRLHAFCHAVPEKWHMMGVMLSAAGSLRWFRDSLAPGVEYNELTERAWGIPAGSEGLLFLPYLTGERTPHPDPFARGAFIGLTVRHTREHMTRAVLEGVAFGLRDSFELMKGAGLAEFNQVRVTGGGAQSALWRQIIADVLGTELVTVNSVEGAAYGAALLAATGAGAFPDVLTACSEAIRVTGYTQPGQAESFYRDLYPLYRNLYPDLQTRFREISRIADRG